MQLTWFQRTLAEAFIFFLYKPETKNFLDSGKKSKLIQRLWNYGLALMLTKEVKPICTNIKCNS